MRTFLKLAVMAIVVCIPLHGSTGWIEGIITQIDGKGFIIRGVDYYKNEQKAYADLPEGEQKIPTKGDPLYVLDGHLTTREQTLKVGRRCFVFWNRHTQRVVFALSENGSGPSEDAAPPAVLAEDVAHTRAGVIASADAEARTLVLTDDEGQESATKPAKKSFVVLDARFNVPFAEACKPGYRAVAYCYRGRDWPTVILVCSGKATTVGTDKD